MKELPQSKSYPVLMAIRIALIIASIVYVILSIAIPSVMILFRAQTVSDGTSLALSITSIVILGIIIFTVFISQAVIMYIASESIAVILDARNDQYYANKALYMIVHRLYNQ